MPKYEWCHVGPNRVAYIYRYKDGRCGPWGPFYLKVRAGARWTTLSGVSVLQVLKGVPGAILRHQITAACRAARQYRLKAYTSEAWDLPYTTEYVPVEFGLRVGASGEERLSVRIKDLSGFQATLDKFTENHELPMFGVGNDRYHWGKGSDNGLIHRVDYPWLIEALVDAGAIEEDLAILKACIGLS